jgi:hypothetical protein
VLLNATMKNTSDSFYVYSKIKDKCMSDGISFNKLIQNYNTGDYNNLLNIVYCTASLYSSMFETSAPKLASENEHDTQAVEGNTKEINAIKRLSRNLIKDIKSNPQQYVKISRIEGVDVVPLADSYRFNSSKDVYKKVFPSIIFSFYISDIGGGKHFKKSFTIDDVVKLYADKAISATDIVYVSKYVYDEYINGHLI